MNFKTYSEDDEMPKGWFVDWQPNPDFHKYGIIHGDLIFRMRDDCSTVVLFSISVGGKRGIPEDKAEPLAEAILSLLTQQNPVKPKETTFPVKLQDNPSLCNASRQAGKHPFGLWYRGDLGVEGVFEAGVQWMLDQIHAKDVPINLHPALVYEVVQLNVNTQSFCLMQGNGCSLTITSDADGDSQFNEQGLKKFAESIRGFLNHNYPSNREPKPDDSWVVGLADEIHRLWCSHHNPPRYSGIREIIRKHAPK